MVIQSIRARLLLWLAFLLVCMLSGFGMAVYQLQRVSQFSQLDEELERRVAALRNAVRGGPRPFPFLGGPKPEPTNAPKRAYPPWGRREFHSSGNPEERGPRPRDVRLASEIATLFEETRPNSYYFAVWTRAGTLQQRSTNAPADLPRPERVDTGTLTRLRMRGEHREAFYFTDLDDCVLAGCSIAGELIAMRRLRLFLLAAGGTVLALGLGGGWWLVSHAIRPVKEISAAASRISAGHLAERIKGADADSELGRLATVLNSTFARLEAAFAQQRQFTADASHELRTPIAVLIAEAQATLARPRTAPEYRETVETCLATAQQMRRLTESLLELARFDGGQEPMRRERFDLATKASECLELLRPLAAQRGIQFHADLSPAECEGDSDRLAQVITNLLTNAIAYNRDQGEVRVRTRRDGGRAMVAVADTGPGIADEDLPHIFERFYRADKARARAEGRAGLGLAICKAIAEGHGGSLEVATGVGVGSTFTLWLPACSDVAEVASRKHTREQRERLGEPLQP